MRINLRQQFRSIFFYRRVGHGSVQKRLAVDIQHVCRKLPANRHQLCASLLHSLLAELLSLL